MKEKQIEEMAKVMANGRFIEPRRNHILLFIGEAEALYNAGYRKQIEGAWMTYHCVSGEPSARGRRIQYKTYTCDVCGKSNGRKKSNFCPNCGAKMKGE